MKLPSGNIFLVFIIIFFYPLLASAEEIAVVDFQGRTVSLKEPAKRIISLSPHITENLFTVGAGAQIVATVDYSDYPIAAHTIPRVGGFSISSIESILAYKPDLVIFWGSGNAQSVLKQLLRLNIPVYIDEPETLDDIASSLIKLGILSGHEETARTEAQKFLTGLDSLKKTYKREYPVSVFYQIWNDPLQTLNGSHISSDLISLCGGKNIYASEATIAPIVSKESLFELNPEVILASGISTERPAWLDDWLAYPQLRAVKNKQLFFISADVSQRHTVRILLGAQTLCEKLSGVLD